MAKVKQNFELHLSDDRDIDFPVKDDDGNAITLTGGTAEWAMKKHPGIAANLIAKTLGAGQIVNTSEGQAFRVSLLVADQAALNPGVYYHELEMTLGGKVSTITTGWVTAKATGT